MHLQVLSRKKHVNSAFLQKKKKKRTKGVGKVNAAENVKKKLHMGPRVSILVFFSLSETQNTKMLLRNEYLYLEFSE